MFSVPEMETHFGPIWPFNVAIICFSGAALGIWFHLTIQGCQDYLLDKKYFQVILMFLIAYLLKDDYRKENNYLWN